MVYNGLICNAEEKRGIYMLRFYYVIIISIPFIIFYLIMAEYYMKHRNKYDEKKCYHLVQKVVKRFKKNARIRTIGYGEERLPQEGGYVMYSNHQGKYDAIGILSVHEKPCTIVMDEVRSRLLIVNQFIELLQGVRMSRTDFRQQVECAKTIQKGVEQGRKYIYFPEGGYDKNGNELQDFRPGAFNCVKKAKAPIVPVAIYDSHIPFDVNSLRKVTTQVYFLEPLYYEEYQEMTTQQISEVVKARIEECMVYLEKQRSMQKWNQSFYSRA